MAKPLRQHGQHDLQGHDPITGHAWISRDAVNIRSKYNNTGSINGKFDTNTLQSCYVLGSLGSYPF